MAHAVRPALTARAASAARAAVPLVPADLELEARTRRLWQQLLPDGGRLRVAATAPRSRIRFLVWRLCRTDHRSDPVETTARLLVELAALGAPEAELRPVLLLLDEVLVSCYAGTGAVGARTLEEIDRAEIAADQLEDVVTQERHLAAVGGTVEPGLLDAQAEADEGEAALLLERARVARREARRIRRGLRQHAPAWAGRRQPVTARVVGSRS